jgi:hypothetical protein
MAVMMGFEPGWPSEPEPRECPQCGQDAVPGDIHRCEYCKLRVGCEECMVGTIDGWCCSEECDKKLRKEHDEIDRRWDEKLKNMNGGGI